VEAHFGASRDTVYEIGSITKTMTGLLLAEVSASGALGAQTVLGSLLDLGTSPATGVTLEELVSHRSGLPRLPSGVRYDIGLFIAVLRHRNPYSEDLATLLKQARGAKISGRGSFRYSNVGGALLGQALAAHAGVPYSELLGRNLFGRFGMKQSTVPLSAQDLPTGASSGWSADGAPEEPWTLNAYAPAGGVRSTPGDMTRYAAALLDREFPLAWALDPRWDADEDGQAAGQVGYAWFTDRVDGREITWHNGGTGGFASMLALDRTRARAVLVVVNTAVAVDEIAFRLLLDEA
jgi:CubicO group peptidase (beta-lactamase class C family)